ncbi:MAG: KpsF/GutQ family sugar-phosphate isomerase [Desulfosarcinaceae bacterium]|nr:KpsF/GutQ family sugar-phosphate isomerase [Desulfosarcinaceae bacterium]
MTASAKVNITHHSGSLAEARSVLAIEAQGIMGLVERLDANFAKLVDLIMGSGGRVIVGGVGKSGLIGRKIVATLNSTGTRALFLHPVEAMHGDLGMVSADDIFIALSNSGETEEINLLLPSVRAIGCRVAAFTGGRKSTLASHCDLIIDTGVAKEACPMGLAPTASSTAMLAMGDALAVVLMNRKEFNSTDFKRFHPAGALGQRLAARVAELMLPAELVPWVRSGADLRQAITILDRGGLGALLVMNADGRLAGIVTDGDLRRCFARLEAPFQATLENVMTPNPKTLFPESAVYDALNLMETHQITVLPIVDRDNQLRGILHLHDILGKGEFKFNGKNG